MTIGWFQKTAHLWRPFWYDFWVVSKDSPSFKMTLVLLKLDLKRLPQFKTTLVWFSGWSEMRGSTKSGLFPLTNMCGLTFCLGWAWDTILFKDRNAKLFAVLFQASNVVWCCILTQRHQAPFSTPHHTVPRQQQCHNFTLAFHGSIYTQSNTFGTIWTDVLEAEQMPLQRCRSCSRHPSRSGWPSKRKWFTAWPRPFLRDAKQLLYVRLVHTSFWKNQTNSS